jgi:pyruvate formate lyase activating enzyme
MVPWGYASSVACDPMEKKPFYHFLPGVSVLSFGMLGCNFHCEFCQNWSISQTLRDAEAVAPLRTCSAEELVGLAERRGARAVASTYNEPLITPEWAAEIFGMARGRGMKTCMVSNGFASPEALSFLDPCLDAMNVDLKCFTDDGYRWLGGRLQPVLDTIRALWDRGKWVEVITLVVPEFNDSDRELAELVEFLAGVSVDIPWHVSAYHRDYRMAQGPAHTPERTIRRAVQRGRDAGLKFIYVGNIRIGTDGANTVCPECDRLLVERAGFGVARCDVDARGACPGCGAAIPGVWA